MDKKTLLVLLGNQIKKVRTEKGINQAELARRCDKERSSIERIENGKINTSAHMLYEIAKALEVHPKELWNIEIKES